MKLDHLNKEQREAVLHTEGPLLILAGAGSGKTYKLVVNYTINGGSTQTVTTTKTCP